MRTLFIFLDESGNLDFSPSGTTHFVLAAITTLKPLVSSRQLQKLKYNLLQRGYDIEQFHASEDAQVIRDQVFTILNKLKDIQANFIYTAKRDIPLLYREKASFYGLLGSRLLKQACKIYTKDDYDQITIVFDKALTRKEQQSFQKTIKPELKHLCKPFQIYFHRTLSDFNGQIADYLAWSRYVSLERNEHRPLHALESLNKFDTQIAM